MPKPPLGFVSKFGQIIRSHQDKYWLCLTERTDHMQLAVSSTTLYRFAPKGAITPLFALLLPVLIILCGFAVNLAYMQKVSTELKVATDAAAHAAGRAMSLEQTTEAAIEQARLTAQTNKVGGRTIQISSEKSTGENQLEITFGRSVRGENGLGRYEFSQVDKLDIDRGQERASSVAVDAKVELPLIFQAMNLDYLGGNLANFRVQRRSIATQIDRDIALVLDRSGSMLYFKDDAGLTDTLYDLYHTWGTTTTTPGHYKYAYWKRKKKKKWKWQGYYREQDADPKWKIRDPMDRIWVPPQTESERLISWTEYSRATKFLYDRTYSDNVIYQLERYENEFHTLGDSFSSNEHTKLESGKAQFARDWMYDSSYAARHSRWYYLDLGVTAFLDVLDLTDQQELCSLITFSSSARLDFELQATYEIIRDYVAAIKPYGGTAIGDGLLQGLDPIINGQLARPFAAKTIVVLTDGENNAGEDPESAARTINQTQLVTIHTVTFSKGADQDAMQSVAERGFGQHYHADDGEGLVEIFEEIANNLPTVLTE